MIKLAKSSIQTLITHIRLQAGQLFGDGDDSLSEGEIIPFSGVSKSGAGCIIQAGGAGRSVRWTSGVDVQPTLTRANATLQIFKLRFRIGQFLRVFSIQRSDISLSGLHVFDVGVRQAEFLSGYIALVFISDGVVAVVANRPGHGTQQKHNDSADHCC